MESNFDMIQINLCIKEKQIHRFQKQIYGCQRGNMGRRDKLGAWDLTYTH